MEVTLQLNPQTNEVVEVSARGLRVQPLPSLSPGVYQGAYVVRSGDNITDAAVFGRLRAGQVEAPLVQAGTPVTLDTLPPVVTQRFPQPGSTVSNDRPNILVTFTDRGGAGMNAAAIRLFVNEQDVTARASVTEGAAAYSPPAPLSGPVNVRLSMVDRAGNVSEDRFAFTVVIAQAALIRAVTINPTT